MTILTRSWDKKNLGSNSKGFDDGDEDTEILDDQELFIGVKGSTSKKSLAFMEIMRRNEVNYECFDSVYWPHFNAEIRRGLDSSVVFAEIISHIKDRLSPKISLIYGKAPKFLDTKEESLLMTFFGHEENCGSGKYEFGAEKEILVRDDDQKALVLKQVENQFLVLTILECKGSNSKGFEDGDEDTEILDDQELFIGAKGSTSKKSLAFMEIMRRNEVNYECFDSVSWPHFNAEIRIGLDSSVVFAEIISHIKGSLKSLSSPKFKMSRDDYIAMAESHVSTFSVKQRESIYDIFMHYEKQKQMKRNFDIADVVNHLHYQLRLNGYLGEKIDFIYVEEVQDLPMAQISLFKYVCSNVREGFVFAGDTAQTIARGIYFCFEDIRNLFYIEFLEADNNDSSKEKFMHNLFHLSQNFRTHTSITKLAQSVMELLYHFFPFSVDRLSLEISLIYGEAPSFLDTKEGNI
ncbi:hypothetical protein KI387_028982 [Taxus chinensis]|uniref:UvrD-like helicase ATP-binding domain-containing protein n=1 Tax=Taxus chinensis TaxID=29808 RepID=A0AA38CBL7_TAXCH|nr:hypothetical protein KI387_028982 [Taxus chinensis]